MKDRGTRFYCPKCGEVDELTEDGNKLQVRGFKVVDDKGLCWSHCLLCWHWFSDDLKPSVLGEYDYRGNK